LDAISSTKSQQSASLTNGAPARPQERHQSERYEVECEVIIGVALWA
jgi:hypothetical protein